jgi:hypothetical protein
MNINRVPLNTKRQFFVPKSGPGKKPWEKINWPKMNKQTKAGFTTGVQSSPAKTQTKNRA